MRRRSFLRTVGEGSLVITTGFAGCTGRSASNEESKPVKGTLVEMTGEDVFKPANVIVSAGETVVWRNVGQGVLYVPDHTVTAYEDRILTEAEYFSSGGFTSEQAVR